MKPIIAAMVLLLAFSAQAKEQVYEAEGRFTMGDDDTKLEAQKQAFLMAKMSALEEAGSYVKSIFEAKTTERAGGGRGGQGRD